MCPSVVLTRYILNKPYSNSYPTQRSGNDGGYTRRQNPYAQQDEDPSYEMADVNPSTAHLTSNIAADTMGSFYDEVRTSSNRMSRVLTSLIDCVDLVRPGKCQNLQ